MSELVQTFLRFKGGGKTEEDAYRPYIRSKYGTNLYFRYNFDTRTYAFKKTFNETASQMLVYEESVKNLMKEALDGRSSVVFFSGPMGSGKTYTMIGPADSWENAKDAGIVPRTFEELFDELYLSKRSAALRISFMEVSNEMIYDLLSYNTESLKVKEDERFDEIVIPNLSEILVSNREDALLEIRRGLAKKQENTYGADRTIANTIFVMNLISREFLDGDEFLVSAKISFVDMAASDNSQEDRNINSIPTTLKGYDPRQLNTDSTLGLLFKDAFDGKAFIMVFLTLSTKSSTFEIPIEALDVVDSFKKIPNNVQPNDKISKRFMLDYYNDVITDLHNRLNIITCLNANNTLTQENYQNLLLQEDIVDKDDLKTRFAAMQQIEDDIISYQQRKAILEQNSKQCNDWLHVYENYLLKRVFMSSSPEDNAVSVNSELTKTTLKGTKNAEALATYITELQEDQIAFTFGIVCKCYHLQKALKEVLNIRELLNQDNDGATATLKAFTTTSTEQFNITQLRSDIDEVNNVIEGICDDISQLLNGLTNEMGVINLLQNEEPNANNKITEHLCIRLGYIETKLHESNHAICRTLEESEMELKNTATEQLEEDPVQHCERQNSMLREALRAQKLSNENTALLVHSLKYEVRDSSVDIYKKNIEKALNVYKKMEDYLSSMSQKSYVITKQKPPKAGPSTSTGEEEIPDQKQDDEIFTGHSSSYNRDDEETIQRLLQKIFDNICVMKKWTSQLTSQFDSRVGELAKVFKKFDNQKAIPTTISKAGPSFERNLLDFDGSDSESYPSISFLDDLQSSCSSNLDPDTQAILDQLTPFDEEIIDEAIRSAWEIIVPPNNSPEDPVEPMPMPFLQLHHGFFDTPQVSTSFNFNFNEFSSAGNYLSSGLPFSPDLIADCVNEPVPDSVPTSLGLRNDSQNELQIIHKESDHREP